MEQIYLYNVLSSEGYTYENPKKETIESFANRKSDLDVNSPTLKRDVINWMEKYIARIYVNIPEWFVGTEQEWSIHSHPERLKELADSNIFASKIQVVEQSVFGLLNMQMESINTSIGIREARAILGTISVLENLKNGQSPTDNDKGLLNVAKGYINANGPDHTKVSDLKSFGQWLALTQTQRISNMYELVINSGEELSKAWKDSLSKASVETPIIKLGESLNEQYSKNVLGEDLYNKLSSIFVDLDLGTTMPEISKTVTTKTLALAPKAPTDTSGIV